MVMDTCKFINDCGVYVLFSILIQAMLFFLFYKILVYNESLWYMKIAE